jgi:hypothetical protein
VGELALRCHRTHSLRVYAIIVSEKAAFEKHAGPATSDRLELSDRASSVRANLRILFLLSRSHGMFVDDERVRPNPVFLRWLGDRRDRRSLERRPRHRAMVELLEAVG